VFNDIVKSFFVFFPWSEMTGNRKFRRCLFHLACESKNRECVEYLINEVMAARQKMLQNIKIKFEIDNRSFKRHLLDTEELVEQQIPKEAKIKLMTFDCSEKILFCYD
jgi:hypothetical protein